MTAMNTLSLTAFAAAAALVPHYVTAHGWLNSPRGRQMCGDKELLEMVKPGGGNGSGTQEEDLGGVPGFCGDPFMDKVEEVCSPEHSRRCLVCFAFAFVLGHSCCIVAE